MDDIEALHNSISELELQVANAENERNYYAVKAKKLMSVVKSQEQDEVQKNLIDKSQHIAELSMENYKLKERISSSSAANERLIRERDMENKILQEVVKSVQNESSGRSYRTMNSGYTANLSIGDDDEITIDDDLSLSKAVDSAAMQIKLYIANLENERQDLMRECSDKDKRISQLERSNEELHAKIKRLEGSHGSEENGQVREESGLESLSPPPLGDDVVKKGDEKNIESASEGEYEDEYYGNMYYGYKDVEEDLQEKPRILRSRERSGSMPLGSPMQETRKQRVRRKSDTALKGLVNQRREASEDRSVSSLEIDEESIETVKASANLRKPNSARFSTRRGSDASLSSQNRSTRSLNTSSKALIAHSVLREFDAPGTVKKRPAGSFASPWRSPRFLGKGLRIRSRKASTSPPPGKGGNRKASSSPPPKSRSRRASTSPPRQTGSGSLSPSKSSNKQRAGMGSRVESTPELMSTQRRATAQLKLRQRKSTDEESTRRSPRSPKKDKGHSMKVDGIKGTYTGPLREDVPHGVGTVVFVNGDTYIGNVVNGKLHGCGTLYYGKKKNGIDRGIWRNNERIWQ